MKGRITAVLCALVMLSTLACASHREALFRYRANTRVYLEKALEHEALARLKPWERDILARPDMSWEPDPLQALRRAHIYFSKEASLSGGSTGGGGCGCN